MEARSVQELLAGLQRDHRRGESPGPRLCRACVDTVSVDGAGIMLVDSSGQASPLGVSDEITLIVEDLQFTLGEGPGIEAHASGEVVREPSLHEATARWPVFRGAAVDAGFVAAFAVPLQVGTTTLGSLDLYRHRAGDLDESELEDARALADIVTQTVLKVQVDAAPGDLSSDFDETDLRAHVHQAAGMLSYRHEITVGDALVRLRAHAYAEGRPIDELARAVVERRADVVFD